MATGPRPLPLPTRPVASATRICCRRKTCEPKAAARLVLAPPAGVKPSGEKITVAADALFDFNKAVLRPEGKKARRAGLQAQAIKLEVILAVGHTDRIGGDAYNQKLSEKRAAAVKEYLVAKGIEANRVTPKARARSSRLPATSARAMPRPRP